MATDTREVAASIAEGSGAAIPRDAIVACVLVATAMVAMELTVVATAMPRIVAVCVRTNEEKTQL